MMAKESELPRKGSYGLQGRTNESSTKKRNWRSSGSVCKRLRHTYKCCNAETWTNWVAFCCSPSWDHIKFVHLVWSLWLSMNLSISDASQTVVPLLSLMGLGKFDVGSFDQRHKVARLIGNFPTRFLSLVICDAR